MGTLASGSIDLKSLKVAGEGATKYITTIDDGGIKVHDADDTDNYTALTSDGMEVFQDNNSVAFFGATARVGNPEFSLIYLSGDSIKGVGANGKSFFEFSGNGNGDTVRYDKYFTVGDNGNAFWTTNRPQVITATNFTSGTATAGISLYKSGTHYDCTSTVSFSCDTTSTSTISVTAGSTTYTISCAYNKDAHTFTFTTNSTILGYVITGYVFYEQTVPAPVYLLGGNVEATGSYAMAIGYKTHAIGQYSLAEGGYTTASGARSHAEGRGSVASGDYAHAEGYETTANHRSQHVFGEYNTADPSTAASTARGNYIEIVGNGTSVTSSNARTLDWSGNEVLKGNLNAVNGVFSGSISGSSISTTGAISAASLTTTGAISGGAVSGSSLSTTGTISGGALSASTGTFSGAVTTTGITVGGHSSAIGSTLSNSASTTMSGTSVSTYTNGASISLPAGTWVITGQWQFQARSSGSTNLEINLYDGTDIIGRQRIQVAGTAVTILQATAIYTNTATKTLYVRGGTGAAISTACPNEIHAVRII